MFTVSASKKRLGQFLFCLVVLSFTQCTCDRPVKHICTMILKILLMLALLLMVPSEATITQIEPASTLAEVPTVIESNVTNLQQSFTRHKRRRQSAWDSFWSTTPARPIFNQKHYAGIKTNQNTRCPNGAHCKAQVFYKY